MDAQLKAKWIEALRSGEYKQGKSYLKDSRDGSYCCLGVLCDVAGIADDLLSMNMTTTLPAGVKGPDEETCSTLGNTLNDYEGKTFAEIADYIEVNIPVHVSAAKVSEQ